MKPVSIFEAFRIIEEKISLLNSEEVLITDVCGRIISENIESDIDLPPFNRVTMDGYAVKSAEYEKGKRYSFSDEVHAGQYTESDDPVIKINTGAVLPSGFDTVIPVEFSHREDSTVWFDAESVSPMENIVPRGEDARKGDILIASGSYAGPFSAAVIAGAGRKKIQCIRKPTVSFFTTGDEIVDIETVPGPAQIRNTNLYLMNSLFNRDRIAVEKTGTISDNVCSVETVFNETDSDILFFSGGISKGTKDYVRDFIQYSCDEILFSQVAQRPGKPLTIALKNNRVIVALPGNPLATHIGYEIYGQAVMRKMTGLAAMPVFLFVQAENGYIPEKGRTHWVPSIIVLEENYSSVRLAGFNTSGDMVTPAAATGVCLADSEIKPGDIVKYIHFGVLVGHP